MPTSGMLIIWPVKVEALTSIAKMVSKLNHFHLQNIQRIDAVNDAVKIPSDLPNSQFKMFKCRKQKCRWQYYVLSIILYEGRIVRQLI